MEELKRRPRHDGLTDARRLMFLAELAETGCVRDACRKAGLSYTSMYRARRRMPDLADQWDMALAERQPILRQAAFLRAVEGVEVEVTCGRAPVKRRRYSDALLRFLIERDDRRREREPKRKPWEKPEPSIEEVRKEVLRRVRVISEGRAEEERKEALAYAERMRREGWAP